MESHDIKNRNHIPDQIESWYTQWILVERIYTEFGKTYGLRSSSVFVLRFILENQENCTQSHICEALAYPKQTVSGIVQGLMQKGLVTKIKANEDKRNHQIHLTEEGKEFAEKVISKLKKAEEDAFAFLSLKDREDFTRVNEALTQSLFQTMLQE